MKPIKANLKEKAIEIAYESFKTNPFMCWFLSGKKQSAKGMKALCTFCIDKAIKMGGAYVSSDECGVLLWEYRPGTQFTFYLLPIYMRFICRGCGLLAIPRIMIRLKAMKKVRGIENHMYVSLLASNKSAGNASVFEMKNFLFQMSKEKQLPIYAETCNSMAKIGYERYGFKVYATKYIIQENTYTWFMKRGVCLA